MTDTKTRSLSLVASNDDITSQPSEATLQEVFSDAADAEEIRLEQAQKNYQIDYAYAQNAASQLSQKFVEGYGDQAYRTAVTPQITQTGRSALGALVQQEAANLFACGNLDVRVENDIRNRLEDVLQPLESYARHYYPDGKLPSRVITASLIMAFGLDERELQTSPPVKKLLRQAGKIDYNNYRNVERKNLDAKMVAYTLLYKDIVDEASQYDLSLPEDPTSSTVYDLHSYAADEDAALSDIDEYSDEDLSHVLAILVECAEAIWKDEEVAEEFSALGITDIASLSDLMLDLASAYDPDFLRNLSDDDCEKLMDMTFQYLASQSGGIESLPVSHSLNIAISNIPEEGRFERALHREGRRLNELRIEYVGTSQPGAEVVPFNEPT